MYPVFLLAWIYNPGEVNISIYNAIILIGLQILIFIAVGLQIRLSGRVFIKTDGTISLLLPLFFFHNK